MRSGPLPLIAALALACGGAGPPTRPEIRLGLDECSDCHMIVSTVRTAAVALDPATLEELRFDDLACLTRALAAGPDHGWSIWVHTDAGWLAAEEARFVRSPDTITPMGSGLQAFSSPERAEAATSDPAELYRLSDLVALDPSAPPS